MSSSDTLIQFKIWLTRLCSRFLGSFLEQNQPDCTIVWRQFFYRLAIDSECSTVIVGSYSISKIHRKRLGVAGGQISQWHRSIDSESVSCTVTRRTARQAWLDFVWDSGRSWETFANSPSSKKLSHPYLVQHIACTCQMWPNYKDINSLILTKKWSLPHLPGDILASKFCDSC